MTNFPQIVAAVIQAVPILEDIFMKVFEIYMKKKHKVDVASFISAEVQARKTGNVKELQKILGQRLR